MLAQLTKKILGFFAGLLFLAIILFFIAGLARAAGSTATVSFIYPIAYTDGSPLPIGDIKEATITWSRPSGAPLGSVKLTAPANSTAITGLACGDFSFTVSVTTKSTALYANTTSDGSNPVPYATGVVCKPNPATGVTVS